MPKERTLIIVLGMHRSGTSVLTRVLNLLGADVGTGLLQGQPGINARGFWEHKELIAINENLLSVLERTWYDFQPLPRRWWADERVGALQERAVTFLQEAFADTPLAVIKDPRLCLLLPFWKEAAREAGWRPAIILATRAPWEVSASLCHRDPLGDASANLLWLRYTLDSEKASRDLPRSRVDYAALLEDWRMVLTRVGRELAVDWPHTVDEAEETVAAEIDPGLRHQRGETGGAKEQPESMAEQAYHLLRAEKLNETALDGVWQDFDRLLQDCPVLSNGLEEANIRLFSITNELQALGGEHQQALDVIAEKDQQLVQLAGELEHAVSVVTDRDEQLAYAHGVVEERDAQLQRMAAELEHAGAVVEMRDAQLSHPAVRTVRKVFFLDKQ